MTARKAAFNALNKVAQGGYSTLVLDSILSRSGLDKRDSALTSAIFYGVLENEQLLDYVILNHLSKANSRIDNRLIIILRMGVYQIMLMDKIPDNAAVNEAVKLTRSIGLERASGLVNAVLRSFIRDGKSCQLPDREDFPQLYLSLKYSVPLWLAEKWIDDYGDEMCENILKELSGRPPIYIRINNLKTDFESLSNSLAESNVKANNLSWLDGAAELFETGDIEQLEAYKNGLFHVQDAASQLCCKLLEAKSGDTVCDVCAAPGGKSFTLTQIMCDCGNVFSYDIYPQKVSLIESGAKRLGLKSITAKLRDAETGSCDILADRVLCDVPCSGLGIIRRKPDIKNKQKSDIADLPKLQLSILENSADLLKPGGVLVYSTCTLSHEENRNVVESFLSKHSDFEPYPFDAPCERGEWDSDYMLTLFPHLLGTDGFFIARLKKKGA